MSTLALFPNVVDDGSTDAQCTPRDLALDLGWFDLDPCSNPRSHIKARATYQLERGQDGLALDWSIHVGIPATVWVNGPYSNPLSWCERLRVHKAPWCSLWKLDPTTQWWRELMAGCDGWAPFRARLKYERPGNCGSADFPSALVWGGGWIVPDAVKARLWMGRPQQMDLLEAVR